MANLLLVWLTSVANLPPVSTTPAELVAKFAAGVVDTSGNFAAGVVDTDGRFTTGVVDTVGAPLLSKKIEITRVLFSGAWGNMIHGKNLKQKIS
jgi:hypothetical protein